METLMKKACAVIVSILGVAVALAPNGVYAADDLVYSTNIHAMLKVLSTNANTIIAMPWMFYTPDGAATTNLPIDHLVRPTNLTTGDIVLALTNDSNSATWEAKYASWQLAEMESGETLDGYRCRYWKPVATVSRANGMDGEGRTDIFKVDHGAMALQRGYGVWLYRQNPCDEKGDPIPFYLYGQYVHGGTNVVISGGSDAVPRYVMLANPLPEQSVKLNDIVWDWDHIGENDRIIIPTDHNQDIYCLRLKVRGGGLANQWCYAKMTTNGKIQKTTYITDIPFNPHVGFWYVRRTAGEMSFTWNLSGEHTSVAEGK